MRQATKNRADSAPAKKGGFLAMSEVQEHSRAVMAARLNDLKAVQHRLNVGRSTVFALVASGELRSVKIGRRRLVPETALIEFIDGLQR